MLLVAAFAGALQRMAPRAAPARSVGSPTARRSPTALRSAVVSAVDRTNWETSGRDLILKSTDGTSDIVFDAEHAPAGACSASNTMSDVPSSLFNMRSRPDVSQFVRSTAETTAERSAVGLLTLRAGAVRRAMRCSAPANAGRSASTLILAVTSYAARVWLCASRSSGSTRAITSGVVTLARCAPQRVDPIRYKRRFIETFATERY